MRNAWLIAQREIQWEILGDRTAVVRMGIFVALPVIFVLTNRSPRIGEVGILILALESALFPALSGVALISSTFTQEKENGTIVPLLASPVRDMDIVVGKLLGMMIPVFALCAASLGFFYVLGTTQYGLERVQATLTPPVLYGLLIIALLYLFTAGSWVLIVAAVVKTTRAGQQIAGLLIGISVALFGSLGAYAAQNGEGWPLVALGVVLLISDVVAVQIARRVWRREEVLARL